MYMVAAQRKSLAVYSFIFLFDCNYMIFRIHILFGKIVLIVIGPWFKILQNTDTICL